ncbi:MAG: Stp1/IreP family PP2C-type Ser/Thr phosphatase [Burkholderiaceae bacterium]
MSEPPKRVETPAEAPYLPIAQSAARTHTGLVRDHNEDAIACAPDAGLFVLADGMGGYSAGEVASGMAGMILKTGLGGDLLRRRASSNTEGAPSLHTVIGRHVDVANRAIFDAAQRQPQYEGMGTTLVLAVVDKRDITVAHLGDSRAYRLRAGTLTQITKDHSLLQEQVDAGLIPADLASLSRNKSLVTRALGVDPAIDLEIHDHALESGDVYLLCSDGLTDMVDDAQIAESLTSLYASVEAAADDLIQMANRAGGRDNVSVVLIKIGELDATNQAAGTGTIAKQASKLFGWIR